MNDPKPIGTVYRCPLGPHEFTRPGYDPSNDARCEDHWGKMGVKVRLEYPAPPPPPFGFVGFVPVSPTPTITPTLDVLTVGHPAEGVFEAPVIQTAPEPPQPTSFERCDALLKKVDEGIPLSFEVTEATPPPPATLLPEEPKPPSPRTRRRPG